MLETILGGALGGIARLAPEVLKFFDRKAERKHELALGDQQYRIATAANQTALQKADIELMQSQFVSALDAMKEGVKAQATMTGVKIVDAINSLVRPGITFWIFTLYSIVKTTHIKMAMTASGITFPEAVAATWTADDASMLSAVITFFFIGRVWDRK